ncbi:MAG: D-isomer specific 2-hydroxyacid dehydrogenase NAD-binding [Paenibacillaceae bacterium]|jgi:lactate dehydrogenase-like 2-hydroxyacid dehydrogenase|nr:D-isomer specific 2-hydroxyacid dehydrogenase NAD-binding [Paenibacillaceae bacterium]
MTNRPAVFISGRIPSIAREILSRHYEVRMSDTIVPLAKAQIMEQMAGCDALLPILSDSIDREVIASNPQLKIIANYGAGYNNIDVAEATARGIPVTNTPHVSTNATADFTMGLLIAAARRLVEGDRTTRQGRFTGWAPLYHLGVEVTGKTLGIIGLGSIGQAVARRAQAFVMKVIYNSRTRLAVEEERRLNVSYASLDELLSVSDFVSLHASYHPSIRHMIGEAQLQAMKPSAYLINAARGPLVHEEALLHALQSGIIAGAALDVYEFEPQVTEGLKQLDNVILAPHLGNATVETREAMARLAADNIHAVLQGGRPLTCVNPEVLG